MATSSPSARGCKWIRCSRSTKPCAEATTPPSRISFGDTYNGSAPSPTYSLYRAGGGGGGLYTPSTAAIDATGGTHLLVLQIAYLATGANVSLYLDPVPGGALNTPIATSTFTGTNVDVGRIRIENASGAKIDEMRVGTTYGDVTPVPEPTATAVACAGGVGLLLARRRRRQVSAQVSRIVRKAKCTLHEQSTRVRTERIGTGTIRLSD